MKAPICPRCQTKFRNIQSGVTVVEMFLNPPQPYNLWLAGTNAGSLQPAS